MPPKKRGPTVDPSGTEGSLEGGPEAGALGAGAVGVGGCARLPSSAAGMRSVSSARLSLRVDAVGRLGKPVRDPG